MTSEETAGREGTQQCINQSAPFGASPTSGEGLEVETTKFEEGVAKSVN